MFPVFIEKILYEAYGMKYMLCITNVNGKDVGTYSPLVADKELSFVMLGVIGNLCSQILEVLCTMSTLADKHLRVKTGGPNCDLLSLPICLCNTHDSLVFLGSNRNLRLYKS